MIVRNSYRKRKSYALPLVIILLAVFVSFSALRDLFGARSILLAAFYPFQVAAVSLWNGIAGVPSKILNLRSLSKQNAELKKEVKNLRAKLMLLEEQTKENRRLRNVLGFKQRSHYKFNILAARVIGKGPTPWFSILQINQGSKAGVRKGMPVIVEQGLVGQVIEASILSSKVLLITDAESSVAASDARSRDFGVVKGTSGNKLFMKYVSAGGDILVGDEIITSRISSIFPPGIPVGKVIQAAKREHDLFYHIEIKPAVDLSKIEEVFVLM